MMASLYQSRSSFTGKPLLLVRFSTSAQHGQTESLYEVTAPRVHWLRAVKRSADSLRWIRSNGEVRQLPASRARSRQFSASMLCKTVRRALSGLTGAWVGIVLDNDLRRFGSANGNRTRV